MRESNAPLQAGEAVRLRSRVGGVELLMAELYAADLGEALAQGATLPADWYSDPAVLRLERERIFARAWQYAGRADLVAEPGAYFTTFAGHVPVVVVRDRSEALRAFVNVCRHRGHLVAEGAAQRKTLQCRYHAWTYNLDGKLRTAPRSEREPGFDRRGFSLLPVAVETWGPFVFVNPDPEAGPLEEALGGLPALVAQSGVQLERLRLRERSEWEIASNWKVAVENYLECYHCPVAHPGFSKVIDVDPDAYELRADGLVSSQFGTPRPAALADGSRAPYDPRGEISQAQYHLLWPNCTLNIEAGPGNMSIDVTRPDGPERSVGFTEYFFYEEVSAETARQVMDFANQVGREDAALVESVQQGLSSGMVPQGRLLTTSEHLIQHFQRLVYEALAA
jgi:phenylpropionate dioxygenase-like ring-hydroxylating dioxygenase large terminal subunit